MSQAIKKHPRYLAIKECIEEATIAAGFYKDVTEENEDGTANHAIKQKNYKNKNKKGRKSSEI